MHLPVLKHTEERTQWGGHEPRPIRCTIEEHRAVRKLFCKAIELFSFELQEVFTDDMSHYEAMPAREFFRQTWEELTHGTEPSSETFKARRVHLSNLLLYGSSVRPTPQPAVGQPRPHLLPE